MLKKIPSTMKSVVLLIALCTCTVRCPPPPHPDVLAVRHEESMLPPALRKPALRNPHLREILSLTSLLHKGEMLVFDREAKGVSRIEIYKMLTHAGLIPRKRFPPSNYESHITPLLFEEALLDFPTQDILQHL